MKNLKLSFLFLAIVLSMSIMACENKSAAEKAEEDLEEFGESVGDLFRTEQEELQKDIKDIQSDIEERINELSKDMESASEEASIEIQKQIDYLQQKGKDLDKSLERMGEDISDGWEAFKKDVRQTLNDIEKELS